MTEMEGGKPYPLHLLSMFVLNQAVGTAAAKVSASAGAANLE